ncbi:MAG TPA: sulfite exporter TauE/SafE family protein [Candidatus Solibacter sp.]|nr:sulfite exporter TauE/SafE family protein [Candidatus Solibacter sp.]
MILFIVLLGFGVGAFGGLLGTSGGIILVPALVYLLHMDQHLAQGTSLFILLPPVGLGALREYWREGNVDLRAGILCALGILIGGYLGGLIAVPLSSHLLKGLFGGFLMLAAVLVFRKPSPNEGTAVAANEDGELV